MFCVQIYLHFYLVQHPGYGIFDQCVVTAIGRDFVNIYCPRFGIEERIFVFSSPLYELVRCVARDFSFFCRSAQESALSCTAVSRDDEWQWLATLPVCRGGVVVTVCVWAGYVWCYCV